MIEKTDARWAYVIAMCDYNCDNGLKPKELIWQVMEDTIKACLSEIEIYKSKGIYAGERVPLEWVEDCIRDAVPKIED